MATRLPPGRMEAARLAAGLTIPEVASRLCRSAITVRRWETGVTTPTQLVLIELSRLYAVTPAELID